MDISRRRTRPTINDVAQLHVDLIEGDLTPLSMRVALRDLLPHLPEDRIDFWAQWIETHAAADDGFGSAFADAYADAEAALIEDEFCARDVA